MMMMGQHSTDESGLTLSETTPSENFPPARWPSCRCETPCYSLTPSCLSRSAAPEVFKQSKTQCAISSQSASSFSAGVTLFVAIVSLLTQRRISKDVAMTGEISLRDLILPVGGIKEKVLAAKRAGVSCVLLPDFNRKDLEEIPITARQGIRFEFLKTVDEHWTLPWSRMLREIPTQPKSWQARLPGKSQARKISNDEKPQSSNFEFCNRFGFRYSNFAFRKGLAGLCRDRAGSTIRNHEC